MALLPSLWEEEMNRIGGIKIAGCILSALLPLLIVADEGLVIPIASLSGRPTEAKDHPYLYPMSITITGKDAVTNIVWRLDGKEFTIRPGTNGELIVFGGVDPERSFHIVDSYASHMLWMPTGLWPTAIDLVTNVSYEASGTKGEIFIRTNRAIRIWGDGQTNFVKRMTLGESKIRLVEESK